MSPNAWISIRTEHSPIGSSSLRRHYRTVVAECGQVLSDMTSYQHIFYAMHGALGALEALHKAGYIHRDISPFNIMLVKRPRAVSIPSCRCDHEDPSCPILFEDDMELEPVLMDFDFALDASSDGSHHAARTGTLYFMSSDVIQQTWDRNLLMQYLVINFRQKPVSFPFRQNAFDDVQSFLWMLVWVLLRSYPGGSLAKRDSKSFTSAYNKLVWFYDDAATQITLHWALPGEFEALLSTTLPDERFRDIIGHTCDLHVLLRQKQGEALRAAYSVTTGTIDFAKLAEQTPPAIEACMATMRNIMHAAAAEPALATMRFNLTDLARPPSPRF